MPAVSDWSKHWANSIGVLMPWGRRRSSCSSHWFANAIDCDGAAAELDATEQQWIAVLLDVREALARGVQASRQAHQRLGWRGRFLPRDLFGGVLEGYGGSLRRVDAALEANGVQPIECDGRPVDPARMHVVDVVHRNGVAGGEVVEVVRRGYVRGDRVIRHAEVRAVAVESNGSAERDKTDDPPPSSTTAD